MTGYSPPFKGNSGCLLKSILLTKRPPTLDIGIRLRTLEMVKVYNCGKTAVTMKAIGNKGIVLVMEDIFTKMVMYTQGIGKGISQMELANIYM